MEIQDQVAMDTSPVWCDHLETWVATPFTMSPSSINIKPPDGEEWERPDNVYELDDDEDTAKRMLALMLAKGDFDMTLTVCKYNDKLLECGTREWLVVTDDEADVLWDQELDHYIEECILHELPEAYRGYFDEERWKRDAKIDGRAHSLARYDGNEECEKVDGEWYYIYRVG